MSVSFKSIIHFFLISAVIGSAVSYSKFYLFHISLALLLLSFIYFKIDNYRLDVVKLPTKLHYIFYVMFLWYLLSITWSIQPLYSISYLFYIVCGIAIVITIVYYCRNLTIQNKVFNLLAIVFIVEIVFSLLEVFTDFRLPISPYSPYLSYFGRSVAARDMTDQSIIAYIMQSPTGFQWNPNNLAVTMVIILPFFLVHKIKKIKYIGSLAILILIIMSGSRGVFISFSFVVFLYMFSLSKKKFLIYGAIIPFFIIMLLLSIDTLKHNENKKIREMATSFDVLMVYLFKDKKSSDSIGVRQQLVRNGLDALRDSNYLGVGGGASVAVQEKRGGLAAHFGSMHNFWVEILVDSGVIFATLFIVWYLYMIIQLYVIAIRTRHPDYRYYAQALFLSLAGFILGAVSASSVIYLFPMWILFGFAVATINNYKRYRYENTIVVRP